MATFPDLNDDGKVTRADVLKGRGVPGFNKGTVVKDELPQEMVDRLTREENEANPMVKLRDKIFGAEKASTGSYKGTYNPDKKRGELLKDGVSTGEYFPDKKGLFKDTSGMEGAKKRASELNAKEPVKKAKGGMVGSASKRADGIAQRGKTKGRIV